MSMKRYIVSCLFLVLYNFAFSQSVTYNKVKYYFGDSLNSSGVIKSIERIDSNFYLGIDAYSDTLLYTSYIVKTDLSGNIEKKSIRFGSDSMAYFISTGNGMIIDADTNIVLAGGYIKTEWGGFISKLNKNLDTIWVKHFLFPDSLLNFSCDTPRHRFEAVIQSPDGNYVIIGSYFSDSLYYNNHTYLQKLDKNGEILWRKLYPNFGPCFDIASTSDSGFVFTPHSSSQNEICKTDSLGNIKWYVNSNNLMHFVSFDITTKNDYVIAVSPYVYYSVNNDPYTFLYGLDVTKANSKTGQVIWNKQYIPMVSIKNPTLHNHLEVKVDENENIIIAATGLAWNYDSTASAYKGVLMKLNSNGDSLWSHYYDWGSFYQRDCQFNAVVFTEDGGVLAGGFWNPPYLNYSQGAWLVKVDSLGNAPGMFTLGIEENELIIKSPQVTIYPNPTVDNINLRFEENHKNKLELEIFNSAGQFIMKQQLSAFENEQKVNVKVLSEGVYFVKIESDSEIVYEGKFIKK